MVKGNSFIESGKIIEPFNKDQLQPASYDLSVGEIKGSKVLRPGESVLISTKEKVDIPHNVAGICVQRSSFMRLGLITNVGWIDPGFQGNITLRLFNLGEESVDLRKIDTFAQLILLDVRGAITTYNGHYQNSEGIVESALR